jgi:hypothetical protein
VVDIIEDLKSGWSLENDSQIDDLEMKDSDRNAEQNPNDQSMFYGSPMEGYIAREFEKQKQERDANVTEVVAERWTDTTTRYRGRERWVGGLQELIARDRKRGLD